MKKSEIKAGCHYTAKVSNKLVVIRVDSIEDRPSYPKGGMRTRFFCTNTATGRQVTFRSAQKFRAVASDPNQPRTEESQGPMQRHYDLVKAAYPNSIVLFRMGDFHEAFDKDALVMAEMCDLRLTQIANRDACGCPSMIVERVVDKLLAAGYRVAVCDPAKKDDKQAYVRLVVPSE